MCFFKNILKICNLYIHINLTIYRYILELCWQGFDKKEGGGIELISHIISRQLQIPVSVLMGANLASEVADEMFCETTIGERLKSK